jgi:hypothetical protein
LQYRSTLVRPSGHAQLNVAVARSRRPQPVHFGFITGICGGELVSMIAQTIQRGARPATVIFHTGGSNG